MTAAIAVLLTVMGLVNEDEQLCQPEPTPDLPWLGGTGEAECPDEHL